MLGSWPMSKHPEGIYKLQLSGLTNALSEGIGKTFADKDDRKRMLSRLMSEVDKELKPAPADEPFDHDVVEVHILDKSYIELTKAVLHFLEKSKTYKILRYSMYLFSLALEKAHTTLDCRDLNWEGWETILNQAITFMDEVGDGNEVLIMMRALQQWRARLAEFGVPAMLPVKAPFVQLLVEVDTGSADHVTLQMKQHGFETQMLHLHDLGVRQERQRYLLTVLSSTTPAKVHHMLKGTPGLNKVKGGKFDWTL